MAAAKRGNPTARAGNYAAPVDTTGMDAEMKKTIISPSKRAKKSGVIGRMKDALGVKY